MKKWFKQKKEKLKEFYEVYQNDFPFAIKLFSITTLFSVLLHFISLPFVIKESIVTFHHLFTGGSLLLLAVTSFGFSIYDDYKEGKIKLNNEEN